MPIKAGCGIAQMCAYGGIGMNQRCTVADRWYDQYLAASRPPRTARRDWWNRQFRGRQHHQVSGESVFGSATDAEIR